MEAIAEDEDEEEDDTPVGVAETQKEHKGMHDDDVDVPRPPSIASQSTISPVMNGISSEEFSPKSEQVEKSAGFTVGWRECIAVGMGVAAVGAIIWMRRRGAD